MAVRWRGFGALVLMACLAACQQNEIAGVVETTNGEALPGVAVEVEGQGRFAVSNTRGEYAVTYVPGDLTLRFIKSGYTPGELRLRVEEHRPVLADTVRLWRLPPDQGVFLYHDGRYTAAAPVIPERFVTKEGIRYGTKKQDVEARTDAAEPVLINYSARRETPVLTRLERQTLTLTGEDVLETDIEAWAPVEDFPLGSAPIDEPDHVLRELQLPQPLENGVYAVHWGALAGEASAEPRMFTFRVGPEEPVEGEEGEEGGEGESAEEEE
jgi:hypothetical protein